MILIRTVWGFSIAALATLFFGPIVFVAGLLRLPPGVHLWVARRWCRVLLRAAGCDVRVHGLERVDWGKPHIVVSNHVSSFDVLALAVSLPVPFHFVAKKELERVPIFGPAWKIAGHISIDRADRQQAIASLRRAAAIVEEDGGVIVIFPEGTRSPTGDLQPFKKGAFSLALESGLPIVPAVVLDSERIMPKGSILIHPGVMQLHLGDPVATDSYDAAGVEALMDEVWQRMAAMLAAERQLRPA